MDRILTEVELLNWKASLGTQAVMEYLRRDKEILKDQWAAGSFQSRSTLETTVANAQAIGVIRKLEEIVELSYSQYYEVMTGEPLELPPQETTDD